MIAHGLKHLNQGLSIGLITNAEVKGLEASDRDCFQVVHLAERIGMAKTLSSAGDGPVVVDTAIIPGIEKLDRPLVLVLRETSNGEVSRFNLPKGRPWDLVLIPNPTEHWLPDHTKLSALRIEALGWVYRDTPPIPPSERSHPLVLVATGGGGTPETALLLKQSLESIILRARRLSPQRFTVKQAVGPRLPQSGLLEAADGHFDPGGNLNRHFADADVVISTAGYNSVLELASIGRPTMFIPIPRKIDDQAKRARLWGARLGHGFDGDLEKAALWLTRAIGEDGKGSWRGLGPSGHQKAAKLIGQFLQ